MGSGRRRGRWRGSRGSRGRVALWSELAVLVGRNAQIPALYADLLARDVPAEIVGLGGLLELPEIVEVCSVLALLLGHQAAWPAGRMSVLAGFVTAGESLEQAVHREVGEETGLRLSAVRYVASQPWPFPRSLMLGFVARGRYRHSGGGLRDRIRTLGHPRGTGRRRGRRSGGSAR